MVRMQNNKTYNDKYIQYTKDTHTIILHNLQGQNRWMNKTILFLLLMS